MAEQLGSVILRRAQIPMQDAVIAAPRAQEAIVPSDGTDATIVAAKRLQELILGCVPDLQLSRVRAHCKKGTIAGPLHACNTVIGPNIAQFRHLAVLSGPEVDAGAETHGQNILRRPVHQVEVKVVLQARCVENLERLLRDHALFPVLLGQQLLLLEATVDRKSHSLIFLVQKRSLMLQLTVDCREVARAGQALLAERCCCLTLLMTLKGLLL